jgi:hypothetical protein
LGTIWEELNTKTISDAPSEEIQAQSDPVHIEASNVGVLSSIDLINKVTMRSDGGLIPETLDITVKEFSDNAEQVILTPKRGEVIQILTPVAKVTLGSTSGNVVYILWIQQLDATGSWGNKYRIAYFATSDSDPILNSMGRSDRADELMCLGYGQRLVAEISSFSASKIEFGVLNGRIR